MSLAVSQMFVEERAFENGSRNKSRDKVLVQIYLEKPELYSKSRVHGSEMLMLFSFPPTPSPSKMVDR